MIEKSEKHNPNYLAQIVEIKNLRPHENADRLQIAVIDFQDVITDMSAKEGDVMVFFPIECRINRSFLSSIDAFRDVELNKGSEKGFFEKNCRVRAVKLRGQKSMGYLLPINKLEDWAGVHSLDQYVGKDFDTINGELLLEKYMVPVKEYNRNKQGKSPKLSRLVDGQVHLHVDTTNLRRAIGYIHPNDDISISYKTHGTSWWTSNVLVKRKLNLFEKLLLKFGVKIEELEYDLMYGSRRVVKNEAFAEKEHNHYYGEDLWGAIAGQIYEAVPKGYSLYGECIGFTPSGKEIQKGYDYGCLSQRFKLQVYRITYTNADGLVRELLANEIVEFCKKYASLGLEPVKYYFIGKAKDYPLSNFHYGSDGLGVEDWQVGFLQQLESDHLEKDCWMCKNKVPAEGIVLRKERADEFEPYKLKSFSFLERETKLLDEGQEDMESDN